MPPLPTGRFPLSWIGIVSSVDTRSREVAYRAIPGIYIFGKSLVCGFCPAGMSRYHHITLGALPNCSSYCSYKHGMVKSIRSWNTLLVESKYIAYLGKCNSVVIECIPVRAFCVCSAFFHKFEETLYVVPGPVEVGVVIEVRILALAPYVKGVGTDLLNGNCWKGFLGYSSCVRESVSQR